MSVRIFDTEIRTFADLNKISTADLLDYYNGLTGKNTKQFSKRAKGMQQVWALIEADVAQRVEAPAVVTNSPEKAAANKAKRVETPSAPAAGAQATVTEASSPALNTQVGALVDVLAAGPRTVAEIAKGLKLSNEKRARSLIDAARRAGHSIACVGRGTFSLAGE